MLDYFSSSSFYARTVFGLFCVWCVSCCLSWTRYGFFLLCVFLRANDIQSNVRLIKIPTQWMYYMCYSKIMCLFLSVRLKSIHNEFLPYYTYFPWWNFKHWGRRNMCTLWMVCVGALPMCQVYIQVLIIIVTTQSLHMPIIGFW